MTRIWLSALLCSLVLFACKEKQNSATIEGADGKPLDTLVALKDIDTSMTYFSIKSYMDEQWRNRRMNPYTLLRISRTGEGRPDSSFVPMDSLLWSRLQAPFNAADISNRSFLGRYRYNTFDDEALQVSHLYYEALSPTLFVQKTDISADLFTDLVKSVYIETRGADGEDVISRKLQYIPDVLFQEQVLRRTAEDKPVRVLTEYRFKY